MYKKILIIFSFVFIWFLNDLLTQQSNIYKRDIQILKSDNTTLVGELGIISGELDMVKQQYSNQLVSIAKNLYAKESYINVGGSEAYSNIDFEQLLLAIENSTNDFNALLYNMDCYFDARTTYLSAIPSVWPIKEYNLEVRITSGFGPRIYPITGDISYHKGIDIAGAYNTEIIATADGEITDVWIYHPLYGKMVRIKHVDGYSTMYAHMNRTLVREGQEVKRGDVIGIMGNTGQSRGRHLHYEITKNEVPVNPIDYLNTNHILILSEN